MRARIFRPAKNAMQSGKARTKQWVLEYEPESPRTIDPLMGWTSSADMRQQLCLEFDTSEEAVAYAKAHAIPFQLFEPHVPTPKPKAYSDNFKFDRKQCRGLIEQPYLLLWPGRCRGRCQTPETDEG